MVSVCLAALLGFASCAWGAPQDGTSHDSDLNLLSEFARLAETAGGTVGIGVRHIESGREVWLNRDQRFPMGSVFKLPLAVQLLTLVDKKEFDLSKTMVLQASALRPGSGRLAKAFGEPRNISFGELLETMLIDSDNSATDILWKEAGGSQAVMARLAALGIGGISVDRPTSQLLANAVGLSIPEDTDLTPAHLQKLLQEVPRAKRTAAIAAFFKDSRDTATPEGLVMLLSKLWRQEALSPGGTVLLIDIMNRCNTGKARLRGGLPRWAKVAHKTGTLTPGVTNDVGIITLPGNAGHIAISVQIRESSRHMAVQERAISDIARAAYDHFASDSGRAN